jgi:hypothetical protein
MGRALILFVLGLLTAVAAPAQATGSDSKPVSEPEISDVFYRLNGGSLVPLERQTAIIKGGASGFMVMTMKVSSEFPGSRSPVRFSPASAFQFVVRSMLAASSIDFNTIYCLRQLDQKKKSRQLIIMSGHASPIGASTSTNLAQGVLPVEFARYGTSSLKLTIGSLPPGEYAVSRVYAQVVFCFGVD